LKNRNWPEPIIEVYAQGLKIVFLKPAKGYHILDAKNDTGNDTENDTGNSIAGILNILQENPNITTRELAKMLMVSVITIKRDLDKLRKKGVLKRKGSSRGGFWLVIEE